MSQGSCLGCVASDQTEVAMMQSRQQGIVFVQAKFDTLWMQISKVSLTISTMIG